MKYTFIDVKKVRGQNKLKPIRVNQIQAKILVNHFGGTIQEALNKYIALIAKQRKWSWYDNT